MAGEKTEKASQKKKSDERKKGNIFLSQEVVTVFSLLIMFFSLKMFVPAMVTTLQKFISDYFTKCGTLETITAEQVRIFFTDSCMIFAQTTIPLLLICSLVAIVFTMLQTKMLFSAKAFAFKGERLNPLSGIKKLISMRSFVELLKALIKVVVVCYLLYTTLKDELLSFPRMMDMGFLQAASYTGQLIVRLALKIGGFFVAIAGADYLFQWWQYEKNLRMSKQEIKDEYKQIEGDPQVKSMQRSRQQQQAKSRMMQKVPSADVVIRNPTHYAVAIQYNQDKNRAPIVVAKGMDSLALRIIDVAEKNGVYITEDRPLARALYESVALDQEIPEKFYQAMAQVLAFVYNLKKQKGGEK